MAYYENCLPDLAEHHLIQLGVIGHDNPLQTGMGDLRLEAVPPHQRGRTITGLHVRRVGLYPPFL